MCQNTPQLCWADEWSPLSPGACLRVAASAKAGERVRPPARKSLWLGEVRGK